MRLSSVSNAVARVCLDSNDCKQCGRVLAEIEHIDDEADGAGIKFVKIDDKQLSKQYGVFALPAILFFKMSSKEPVIYAGTTIFSNEIVIFSTRIRILIEHLCVVDQR